MPDAYDGYEVLGRIWADLPQALWQASKTGLSKRMTTELLASLAEALGSRYDDEEEADFPRLRRAANTLAASVGSHTELGQLLAIAADAAVRRQRGQRARDKTATDDTSGQMDE